jgi:nitroreductase
VRYAVLAPSGHNTQPWRFEIHDGTLDLRADRRRACPSSTPDDRALTLSCGAALETLRIRRAPLRPGARGAAVPDPADADLLARVSVASGAVPDADEEALFGAIAERRTNRRAFEDRPGASPRRWCAGSPRTPPRTPASGCTWCPPPTGRRSPG